jgi:acyl carrier protein
MSEAFADLRAEEILAILAHETSIDRAALRPDATLEELGVASLDLTQAIFEMESRFDIEISVVTHQEGAEFVTIGALVRHVLASLDRAAAERRLAAPDAA